MIYVTRRSNPNAERGTRRNTSISLRHLTYDNNVFVSANSHRIPSQNSQMAEMGRYRTAASGIRWHKC
jgi:hypothetical protein